MEVSQYRKLLCLVSVLLVFFLNLTQVNAQSEGFKTSEKNEIDTSTAWTYHYQVTTVYQEHPPFQSPYAGANSLHANYENALSLTGTVFLGRKLWKGAAFYFNPEIAGGKGISGVFGAGSPFNGETFRIGNIAPTPYVGRAYLHQSFALEQTKFEQQEDEKNELGGSIPTSRFVINIGKFSLADFFDDNKFAHDPRAQFLNWSLMANTAWDYAANTRGYTAGIELELIKPTWAIRFASAMVPTIPNGMNLDNNVFQAHSDNLEFEHKLKIKGHRGKIRVLAYHTISKAPNYREAINQMAKGDSSLIPIFQGSKEWYTYGGQKFGAGLSYDQDLSTDLSFFARAGWCDGHTATWAFTEVDHSASIGFSCKATRLNRPQDVFGIGYVAAGLSKDHRDYLNAGGLGFSLGDGQLKNYAPEQVLETFYCYQLTGSLWISLDYQLMVNPGYNSDRGPVNVYGTRIHIEM